VLSAKMQSDEKVLMSEQTEPNIHVDCTSKSDQSPEQQPAARDTRWHPLHKGAPIRDDDVERVNVLKSLSLLDTDAEESFDRITQAAAATLKVRSCTQAYGRCVLLHTYAPRCRCQQRCLQKRVDAMWAPAVRRNCLGWGKYARQRLALVCWA
jgi:hypothetical protein